MTAIRIALAVAVTLAAVTAATADGTPRRWRGPAYAAAGISYNQITPYYIGYYPTHYSHFRPDPVPRGYAYGPRLYRDGCWFAYDGVIWWGC